MMIHAAIATPIGTLHALSDGTALLALRFPEEMPARPMPDAAREHEGAGVLSHVREQLDAYFAGRLTNFDLPLAPGGTDFRRAVWAALVKIPFGESVTYASLARCIGRPDAVRAVGAANGANPIPIIVPCHRVIGSNGSLTGYAGGLERKRWLIAHERGDRVTSRNQ